MSRTSLTRRSLIGAAADGAESGRAKTMAIARLLHRFENISDNSFLPRR